MTIRRVLLVGRPGSRKTLVARDMWRALPPMSEACALDLAWLRQGLGLWGPTETPFRAPHHTVSERGLVGSWSNGKIYPGEVSFAHGGCLLLDDLSEFRRMGIQHLGEVLRKEHCMLRGIRIPAAPTLVVATTNLCDCGPHIAGCTCSAAAIEGFWRRVNEYSDILNLDSVYVTGRYASDLAKCYGRAG